MIRINLLPVKAARKRQSANLMILVFLVALALEAGAIWFVDSEQATKLSDIKLENAGLQKRVAALQEKVDAVHQIEVQKKALEQQKTVLKGLMEGQTGPVKMLDELALIITPIEDPVLKLAARKRGWNPDWDPRHLWLDTFVERERVVTVTGHARSNDDLAEFLHRLNTSRHFVDVNLNFSQVTVNRVANEQKMIQFSISALALYGPADLAKLAKGQLGATSKRRHKRKRR